MVGDGHIDLPEGIEFEILLKLPVTSITRFKCVCRYWYNVIESREFKEQYYALQNNSIFSVEDYYDVAKVFAGKNLRVVDKFQMAVCNTFITNPCRGLFLMRSMGTATSREYHFGLFNPATRAFRLLPNTAIIPDLVYCVYGLGWDPDTDDYKVVVIPYPHQTAALYSLNSDSWRLLDSPIPKLCSYYGPWQKIYLNGFCYWLSLSSDTHPFSLVSFDVAQEKFVAITLPPNVIICGLAVLSTYYNSLALLVWDERHQVQVIDVWVLGEEQQWTKVFSFTKMDASIHPIGIFNNSHVLLIKYGYKDFSTDIFMYDMNNDRYDGKVDSIKSFLNYKISLFSVKGGCKDWTTSQSADHIRRFKRMSNVIS